MKTAIDIVAIFLMGFAGWRIAGHINRLARRKRIKMYRHWS